MYPKHFFAKVSDAISENFETQVWLDFALGFKYISRTEYQELSERCQEEGRLLNYMLKNTDKFCSFKEAG